MITGNTISRTTKSSPTSTADVGHELEFLFVPTSDLTASLALYRDHLGFTEVWREGDATAALDLADGGVQIMLDANDPDAPVGPLFVVDDVKTFHAERSENLSVVAEPSEIPGGFLALYQDLGGATIYVMDQSTDSETSDNG